MQFKTKNKEPNAIKVLRFKYIRTLKKKKNLWFNQSMHQPKAKKY